MHGPPIPNSLRVVADAICAQRGFTFVRSGGAGAFKDTYEVHDAAGKSLALKVFRPNMSAERTDREIDAMRRCSHANIARVLDIQSFTHNGEVHVYLVEDFLPGGSLEEHVGRNGLFSAEDARRLSVALVSAIGHIAEQNLVHRDLKPANILLDANGMPVIVDFGIVRDLAKVSLTQSWAIRGPGTPFFASPEQLNNQKELIDWRADQFSLGVAISIVTFGVHPYAQGGMTMDQIVEAVANRLGPTAHFGNIASAAGLPAISKMLAPWPVGRYRTSALLAAAWEVNA